MPNTSTSKGKMAKEEAGRKGDQSRSPNSHGAVKASRV
jgi:hypothetical protein